MLNKEFFINFSILISKVRYIIDELGQRNYFDGLSIFSGIQEVNSKYVKVLVTVKNGFPIADSYLNLKFPTEIFEDDDEIEKLIENTLRDK